MAKESANKNKLTLGIDLGGTDVKFGVVSGEKMVYQSKISTNTESAMAILDEICDECKRIYQEYPYEKVGMGVPGVVRDGLLTTDNLPFLDVPVVEEMEKRLGLPVLVDNDANCAALGETLFGKGKGRKNTVLITIGTGIGGGVIIDGKLLRGRGGAGELGDMTIQAENGLPCNCGSFGCWEQYASTSALVRQAKLAAEERPESILGMLYADEEKQNGVTFFLALESGCTVAQKVYDTYLDWLCIGLKSLVKIFDPEVIFLGGGITGQGDVLLKPLMKKMGNCVPVEIAALQNNAGVFGAANL